MKRYFVLLALLTMLLFMTVSALAQDDTPVPVDTDTPTLEATATELPTETSTPEPTETPVPVPPVIIEVPPATTTSNALALIERLGYWLVIIAMAYIIYTSNKSLRDMVSIDTVKALYQDARGVVNTITTAIPGKVDDAIAEMILNRVNEYMDKYYAPPVEAQGAVTVNVNPTDKTAG